MRKKIVLLPLLLMALFVSCSDVQSESKAFDIVGTKWEAVYRFDDEDPKSALVSVIFNFKTSTEVIFEHTIIKEGNVDPDQIPNEPISFSYTYITPTLKILSTDKKDKTVYTVDEKTGTMSIVGKEIFKDGKWVEDKDDYNITLRLKK